MNPQELIDRYADKLGVRVMEFPADKVKAQLANLIQTQGSAGRNMCRNQVSDWYLGTRSGYKISEVRLWVVFDKRNRVIGFSIVAPSVSKRNTAISKFGNKVLDARYREASELIAVCVKPYNRRTKGVGSLLVLIGAAVSPVGMLLEVGYVGARDSQFRQYRLISPTAYNAYRKLRFTELKRWRPVHGGDPHRIFMFRRGKVTQQFADSVLGKYIKDMKTKAMKSKRYKPFAINLYTGRRTTKISRLQ
jgi:hypothetical protein